MKIDFSSIDPESFEVKSGSFCGEDAILITPSRIGVKWNLSNLIFRSSVWRKSDGKLLSAGFKKFFNYGEKPDLYPHPEKHKDWRITEKIDGSLAIIDCYNGQVSIRTRGSFSVDEMENKDEFYEILKKYPALTDFFNSESEYSILGELVSPNNQIVIKYEQPDLFIHGVIDKHSYRFIPAENIEQFKDIPKPKVYTFKSLEDIYYSVSAWKGLEGVVLSYKDNQERVKLKSDWYCHCHKIKSLLNTDEALIDLFLSIARPNYLTFFNYVCDTFDYEIANQFRGTISRIVDANKEVEAIIRGMVNFCNYFKDLTRKEFALKVISSYGETNRASFVFNLKNKGCLEDKHIKKLLFQVLK